MSTLLITSTTYLQLMYSYFFYNESNKYYIGSRSSHRKIKDSFKYIVFMNENEIIKQSTLFSYENHHYKHHFLYTFNQRLEGKKNTLFKESFYDTKGKIKIIGRGWKITKFPYELLVKLGYSHPIFLPLDPYLKYKLKKKKKKYYVFYGTYYHQLNTLLSKFHLMRVPDTYTRKGIFQRKIIL